MSKIVYKGAEVSNNRNIYNDLLGKPTINGNEVKPYNTALSLALTWCGTQTEYDALPDKNLYTLYIIKDVDGITSKVVYEHVEHKPAINGITLFSNTTYSDLDLMTRTEIENKLVGVFTYRGMVNLLTDLPNDPLTGDVYYVDDANASYAWNGASWDNMGSSIDLTAYQKKLDAALTTENKLVVSAINELESDKQEKYDEDLETTSKNVVGAINELNKARVYVVDLSSDRQPEAYVSDFNLVTEKSAAGHTIIGKAGDREYLLTSVTTTEMIFNRADTTMGELIKIASDGTRTRTTNVYPEFPMYVQYGWDATGLAAGIIYKLFTFDLKYGWDMANINFILSRTYPMSSTSWTRDALFQLRIMAGGDGTTIDGYDIIQMTGGMTTAIDRNGGGLLAVLSPDKKSLSVYMSANIAVDRFVGGCTIVGGSARSGKLRSCITLAPNGNHVTDVGANGGYKAYTRTTTNTNVAGTWNWLKPAVPSRIDLTIDEWKQIYNRTNVSWSQGGTSQLSGYLLTFTDGTSAQQMNLLYRGQSVWLGQGLFEASGIKYQIFALTIKNGLDVIVYVVRLDNGAISSLNKTVSSVDRLYQFIG